MVGPLTEWELLRAAARQGCELSKHQLKRLRMAGLVQRPTQVHRQGFRGSVALYPPGSDAQLIAVCRLRREERRLDELRFRVWWEGGWVEPSRLRETLRSLVAEQLDALEAFLEGQQDLLHAIEEGGPESRHPTVRLIRRNLGGDSRDLATVLHTLGVVALGDEPVWDIPDLGLDEPSPLELVQRAVGLDRHPSDEKAGIGPLIDQEPDVARMLGWLRGRSVWSLLEVLEDASDEELARARDGAKVFTEDLPAIVLAVERIFGRNAFGLGFFRLFTSRRRMVWTWKALAIPGFVLLHRYIPEELLDVVSSAVRDAAPKARAFLQLDPDQGRGAFAAGRK